MAADDFYALTPIAPLPPDAMGLPPGPQAPVFSPLPMAAPPSGPNTAQKGVSLAALAAMIAGGPKLTGLGSGVLQGQHEQERKQFADYQIAEQQRRGQEQQQAQQVGAFNQQQRLYQQELDQRQQTFMGAVDSIRKQVSTVKDKATYDTQMEGFANLLRASGFRVDSNWLKLSAPFVAPNAKDRASKALDDVFKSPLTAEAMKTDPARVMSGRIQFDANNDGVPESVSIQQLAAIADRPMLADDQGNLIVPTKEEGKAGTQYGDLLHEMLETFRAENQREPTRRERLEIVRGAIAESKEKPEVDLSPLAAETAGLRNELLRAQIGKTTSEKATDPVEQEQAGLRNQLLRAQIKNAENPEPREPSQAAYTAAGYAERIGHANDIIKGLEQSITGMSVLGFEAQKRMPTPALQSSDFQSYDQAARNFINAQLRRESGAVITPAEFANANAQYLPVPGNDARTLAQKRQNREQVFASIKAAAGRAYQGPVTVSEPAGQVEQWVRDPKTGKMIKGKK